MPILDNHGRPITYVRLAVTDRCNLRCFYCMPAEGIQYVARKELLTYEEMLRLVSVLARMGITKVRITGGEPFLRRDLIHFLKQLVEIEGIKDVHITTNGVITGRYLEELKAMGIASMNLSLDTLDPQRFYEITRRNEFEKVWACLEKMMALDIPTKINTVVMDGRNTEDIVPLVGLTEKYPIGVRFIEEMPFNGSGGKQGIEWNHKKILAGIKERYPNMQKITDGPHSTSFNYQIPGFPGSFGVIPAFSRTFCGSCNRIRLTARGQLKTCLYDDGVLDMKDIVRSSNDDAVVEQAFLSAFGQRAQNGFEAEKRRQNNRPIEESMSTIGG
ncbi:MAG: GTP 3',8-cyclase MoaA [Bacteroidota bacterium]